MFGLEAAAPATVTLFLCAKADDTVEFPETLRLLIRDPNVMIQQFDLTDSDLLAHQFDGVLLPLLPPRHLDFPKRFAEKHRLQISQNCATSSPFKLITPTSDEIHTPILIENAPNHALLVAALSPEKAAFPAVCTFFGAVLALMSAAFCFARSGALPLPKFTRSDGLFGFITATFLAYLVAILIAHGQTPNDNLLPGYGETLKMFASNFIGFTVCFFAFYFARFRLSKTKSQKKTTVSDSEALRKPSESSSYPPIAIICGIGLAVLAAVITSFAPLPGLTLIELASQLTSTLLMTSVFAVLAGVCEEFIFRGLVQSAFEARPESCHPHFENAFAIFLATSLFVLLHVPQSLEHLWALTPIALVSIASGIIKLRARSIFPSVLLHMSYNTALLIPSLLLFFL